MLREGCELTMGRFKDWNKLHISSILLVSLIIELLSESKYASL